MKTKLTLIFVIIIQLLNSQERVLDFIIPIKTYHFDRSEVYRYSKHEGGNFGLIVSYTKGEKILKNVYSIGLIKNSFGKGSFIATYGKSIKATKWLRFELNIGLATNYKDAYYATWWNNTLIKGDDRQPHKTKDHNVSVILLRKDFARNLKFFYNNNLIPMGALSTKIKINNFSGLNINLNPSFINIGLMITTQIK